MSTKRTLSLAGAVIFLVIAGLALYRLMFGFPITVAGVQIGQTSSVLLLATCAALSIILFRGKRNDDFDRL